jgi:hypothetical protein
MRGAVREVLFNCHKFFLLPITWHMLRKLFISKGVTCQHEIGNRKPQQVSGSLVLESSSIHTSVSELN